LFDESIERRLTARRRRERNGGETCDVFRGYRSGVAEINRKVDRSSSR
jgi:hypothetical protein